MYWFGARETLGNVNVTPLSNRSPASGSVVVPMFLISMYSKSSALLPV